MLQLLNSISGPAGAGLRFLIARGVWGDFIVGRLFNVDILKHLHLKCIYHFLGFSYLKST